MPFAFEVHPASSSKLIPWVPFGAAYHASGVFHGDRPT